PPAGFRTNFAGPVVLRAGQGLHALHQSYGPFLNCTRRGGFRVVAQTCYFAINGRSAARELGLQLECSLIQIVHRVHFQSSFTPVSVVKALSKFTCFLRTMSPKVLSW